MAMIDTIHAVETPEGIELELRIAGPVVRALAWMIDFVIRIIVYIIAAIFLGRLGLLGQGLFLVLIFLLEWFYPVIYEVYRGYTPGKHLMKIKVLHESGIPVDWSTSMVRNLLRVIDFLPFFYGCGLVTMLLNAQFKRIGDLAAGTVVVYQDEIIKKHLTLPQATPIALSFPLTLEEQRAIVHFAERSTTLSEERTAELANIVTPLIGHSDQPAIQHLYQLANGLVGRHE